MEEMTRPSQLSLGALIGWLEVEDPNKMLKIGFRNPHSYRGYYEELAFEIAKDVTVGEMLKAAKSALGATFQGWKGGDFTMKDYTDTWLVLAEGDLGESIGSVLLTLMLANEVKAE